MLSCTHRLYSQSLLKHNSDNVRAWGWGDWANLRTVNNQSHWDYISEDWGTIHTTYLSHLLKRHKITAKGFSLCLRRIEAWLCWVIRTV